MMWPLGVKDRLKDSPFRLSAGQQRLPCLARALAVNRRRCRWRPPTTSAGDLADGPPVREDSTPAARAQGRKGGDLTRRRTTVARIRVRVVQRTLRRAGIKEYSQVANRTRLAFAAAAVIPLTMLAAACGSSSSPSSSTLPSTTADSATNGKTISETGSTLLFPLFGDWQTAYSDIDSSVTITSGATGSGTGIADAANDLVNIGAADEYLPSSDLSKYPGLLNIPLTVAAVDVNYNVTGVKKPLNLSGTVLAEIYTGKITTWNNSAIAKLNPGVSLPAEPIVTLHRADSSGQSLLFTSYLNAQDPSAWPSSDIGTTITWPSVPGSLSETGQGGMLSACGTTKGCIAYIGISYLSKATAAGLGTASLADKSGTYEAPTSSTIGSALSSFPAVPASGDESLLNSRSGYPIVNYEYAIVKKAQPSAAEATAVKKFLTWVLDTGDTTTYLSAVNFLPLPAATKTVATNLVNSISG
jgi:phosphate transport system substrate-binding protein